MNLSRLIAGAIPWVALCLILGSCQKEQKIELLNATAPEWAEPTDIVVAYSNFNVVGRVKVSLANGRCELAQKFEEQQTGVAWEKLPLVLQQKITNPDKSVQYLELDPLFQRVLKITPTVIGPQEMAFLVQLDQDEVKFHFASLMQITPKEKIDGCSAESKLCEDYRWNNRTKKYECGGGAWKWLKQLVVVPSIYEWSWNKKKVLVGMQAIFQHFGEGGELVVEKPKTLKLLKDGLQPPDQIGF